jgi:hypothetical protein
MGAATNDFRSIIFSPRSLRPRVSFEVVWFRPVRQRDAGGYPIDRENPSVARHVPIKLVMRFEETDLMVRFIHQFVGVVAGRKFDGRGAEIDAGPVPLILFVVRFRLAIASDTLDVEPRLRSQAPAALI